MFSHTKIVIVDDIIDNIRVALNYLKDLNCEIIYALNGKDALDRIIMHKPNLILMDVMMPDVSGFDVVEVLNRDSELSKIPVIFLTAKNDPEDIQKGFELGCVDYILKPFNGNELVSRVKTHLKLSNYQKSLENEVFLKTLDIENLKNIIIEAMGNLAEYRDNETGEHIKRTQMYIKLMCQYMIKNEIYQSVIDEEYIKLLIKSAPLHDIGKIAISDSVLLKPGKLNEQEFEIMKKHTLLGEKIIDKLLEKTGPTTFLEVAKEIAGKHHEKWDGSGYPYGLSKHNIPLCARIMAIVDVYDALVSKRVYKDAFPHEQALEIIRDSSGTHFEPILVMVFLAIEKEFNIVQIKFKD